MLNRMYKEITIIPAVAIFYLFSSSLFADLVDYVPVKITPQIQINAAKDIINRITPTIVEHFKLEIIAQENGLDVFEIESLNGKIVFRGSTGVALASAYNWYLKHYCNCQLSWCGDQLNLPKTLPVLKTKLRKVCLHKYRTYFNYCTLSYTASWWNWKRWQREIDFMAMNGINMPLSVIGLEGVWYNTLLKFGFSDQEAREYLVGPTFFAWQWMTNIQSHGGPLPKNWIDSHIILGRQIITAQRKLGMRPIQQGFSGCVPRKLKEKFPKANILNERGWGGFKGTCQLDPLDPLFKKFGKAFIQEEIRLFGTAHVYAADPFHEGTPPKSGDEYLGKVGKAIYELLMEVDPKATWAMQSWSLRKAIVCAVPKDCLLVLDLNGKHGRNEFKNFWGYNFVKGQLHNFGNRINLHGDLRYLARNPFAATAKKIKNTVGTGLFMEGIMQNPVFYNLYFDLIWRDQPVDINQWLNKYAQRRYGAKSKNAEKAWQILLENPYKPGTNGVESSSIIAARPAVHTKKSGPNAGFRIPYEKKQLVKALELLLKDSDILGKSDAYRYDVVDICRQVLSNHGQTINKNLSVAFIIKDKEIFKKETKHFVSLLKDVDKLLASRKEFMLGTWVNDARSWGKTKSEKDYYQWNASMLITIWGPFHSPRFYDYSWREWSGLINDFYLPRWEKFFAMLQKHLDDGTEYTDPKKQTHGREAWDANQFYVNLGNWECQWTKSYHKFSRKPQGDSVQLAKKYLVKYKNEILHPVRNSYNICSPDKKIELSFAIKDLENVMGRAFWSVNYQDKKIIKDGQLSFILDKAPALVRDFEIINIEQLSHKQNWKPLYGEFATIPDNYNQMIVTVKDKYNRIIKFIFRAYNEGVALRTEFPYQKRTMKKISIRKENTEFCFVGNHQAWAVYSAQGVYKKCPLKKIKRKCERPLILETKDGLSLAILEAGLYDYARAKISYKSGNTLVTELSGTVKLKTPAATPWRVLLIGDNECELLQHNYILPTLSPKSIVKNSSWIKPGKQMRDVTITEKNGIAMIDAAANLGLDYVEIDAGWYGNERSEKSDATTVTPTRSRGGFTLQSLKDVIKYAKSKNMGVILYVNRRHLERQLDEILPLYKKWGVAGIKFGFVQVGTQKWTAWLHESIKKCADYKMVVDVHDEYRPTGIERTLPNFLTAEGIRGNEAGPTPEMDLTTCFARSLCGPADFTMCWFSKKLKMTWAHQMAATVVYYSPLQTLYWYDTPKRFTGKEPYLQFFRDLPTVWVDKKVIQGKIGQYITLARKTKADAWFVGSMNAQQQRQIKIPLTFLTPDKKYIATIYSDAEPTTLEKQKLAYKTMQVTSKTVISADMSANGGQAIYITPQK